MSGPGGLTPYHEQYGSVDLSNVVRTAGQIGRDTADADYYTLLAKKMHEQHVAELKAAKKAATAQAKNEKAAAAQDLGNEPQSSGFWSKLGDVGLAGLQHWFDFQWNNTMWVVDKLSRVNYGVANSYDHLSKRDDKWDKKHPHGSEWEYLKMDWADLPNAANAFWKGVKGEQKTTFSKVIAGHAKRDHVQNWRDNKWMQGGVGLTMDIALDPTTYVGVGVVTRPVKALSEGAKGFKALDEASHMKALNLSEDISKLPGGAPKEAGQVHFSKDQIYQMITGRPLSGGRMQGAISKAGRAKQAEQHALNIGKLKKYVREMPEMDKSSLDEYNNAIDELSRLHNKELDNFATSAFAEAGARWDAENAPKVIDEVTKTIEPAAETLPPVGKLVDDSLHFSRIAHAFGRENWYRWLVSKTAKDAGIKTEEAAARLASNEAKIAENFPQGSEFDQMLGNGWAHDPALENLTGTVYRGGKAQTVPFKENAFEIVRRLASQDPKFQAAQTKLYANAGVQDTKKLAEKGSDVGLVQQLSWAQRDLAAAQKAGKTADVGRLEQDVHALKQVVEHARRTQHNIMADVFTKIVGGHTGQFNKVFSDETAHAITEKKQYLESLYAKATELGDNAPEVKASADLNDGVSRLDIEGGNVGSVVGKPAADIQRGESGVSNAGLEVQREIDKTERELMDLMTKGLGEGDSIKIPASLADIGGTTKSVTLVGKNGADTPLFRKLFTRQNNRLVVKEADLTDEEKHFANAILGEITSKQHNLEDQYIRTYKRAQRAAHKLNITHDTLKKMFGVRNRGTLKEGQMLGTVPRIKIGDKWILKTDKQGIRDAGLVTSHDKKWAGTIQGKSVLGIDDVIKHFENVAKVEKDGSGAILANSVVKKMLQEGNFLRLTPDQIYHRLIAMPRVADESMDTAFELVKKIQRFALDEGIGASHVTAVGHAPEHLAFDRAFYEHYGVSVAFAAKAAKTAKNIDLKAPTLGKSLKVPPGEMSKIKLRALNESLSDVSHSLERGTLRVTDTSKSLTLKAPEKAAEVAAKAPESSNPAVKVTTRSRSARAAVRGEQAAKDMAKQRLKMEYQHEAAKIARERGTASSNEIKAKLDALRGERDLKEKAIEKAYQEAKMTREAMDDRLDEQYLLDLLTDSTPEVNKAIKISFAGRTLGIGSKHMGQIGDQSVRMATFSTPKAMLKMTDKMLSTKVLKSTAEVWADAFSPASKLEPALNEARLRMTGNINDVLKHHLDEIFHAFNKFSPKDRVTAFKQVLNNTPVGTNTELFDTTKRFLEDFIQYTDGSTKVGGETLKLSEIKKYLPEEFKFAHPEGRSTDAIGPLKTPKQIISAMRHLKPDTDPMKIMWHLRIAAEKAMAEKAMRFTIAESFGVKRVLQEPGKLLNAEEQANRDVVEALAKKHSWSTIDGFHEKYYFEAEAAKDIEKLMDMMRPERVQKIVRLYDKALRTWKSTVTVYNPGYYTRNAIGEVIMGAFDGVHNPVWYHKAGQVLKYAQPDSVQEALKSITPWKRYQTVAQAGARPVMRLKNGKPVNAEQVWVLFHDNNLKSGFISTEYDHAFPAAGSFRSNPVGQVATNINDKMRGAGEKFEDYFRVAHFMNRMARSNQRTVEGAAKEAARYVRKYHFDYSDFTPFEKTWLMRVIPFYKWSRKAMPLMAGMLFTRPGLVNLYPKTMSNLSVMTGGVDPLHDPNGFQPNYEKVTPDWIKASMAYPIGRDQEGNMDYAHLATPAFDIYKMFQNPASATIGMMSPGIKFPYEQATGETMDPAFKVDVKTAGQRFDNAARLTPFTSMMNNIRKGNQPGEDNAVTEPGAPMDEKWAAFFSGLGIYENNDKRKQGEQLRRAGIQNASK